MSAKGSVSIDFEALSVLFIAARTDLMKDLNCYCRIDGIVPCFGCHLLSALKTVSHKIDFAQLSLPERLVSAEKVS